MPPEAIAAAAIAATSAILAALLTYVTQRSKIRIESVSTEAAATLARAQATDIGFENLLSLYNELKRSNDELRAEVAELRATIDHFSEVIRILPTEYQVLFRPGKGKQSPKAAQGE